MRCGQNGQHGGCEQRGDLRARERGDQHSIGRHRDHIDQDAEQQSRKAALERDPEDEQRHQEHQGEIGQGDADVGKLLADQKFESRDGRHVEVDDRSEFLLANDGERHQDGRKDREQHRHVGRDHRVNAVEVLVVLEADFDIGGRERCGNGRLHRRVGQVERVHRLHVAANGFGAERHRAIDPGAHRDRATSLDVAAEAGRDFDRGLDRAAPEPFLERVVVGEHRLLDKVARSPELLEIGSAFGTLVPVEHREGEAVDVGRDAKAEHQHQERRAEQAEAEPDRVAHEFEGFPDRIGEHAPQAEP